LKVATLPLNVTVPAILVPALFFRVKVKVVTVELWTASLKVAVIELVTATPVAPSVGLVLTTVGGVVSVEVELAKYSRGSAILSRSPVK
jgi:hypothetical protein